MVLFHLGCVCENSQSLHCMNDLTLIFSFKHHQVYDSFIFLLLSEERWLP